MSVKMQRPFSRTQRTLRLGWCLLFGASLVGCSFLGAKTAKPKPADLGANVPLMGVSQAWSMQLGNAGSPPVGMHVQDAIVTLAAADGTVAAVDSRTGLDVWRTRLGEPLASGVGSDGQWAVVVSQANELVALERGQEKWRKALHAQVFTAPLLAGGRVFVLAADRTLMAFDGKSGRQLWSQPRSGEALVLHQPGVLMAVGNTLVAGLSGKLVGMNPDNGLVRWESPIATARGTNDVERLVELVAPTSRVGYSVCARAFQAGVGCLDVRDASVQWTQKSSGAQGVSGDGDVLYGTQSNGAVTAWRRSDGDQLWTTQHLAYRQLTAPLLLGRSIVVGDENGVVHFLSRDDGSPLTRLQTDGSSIAANPVAADGTLVVATRKGRIYGFRPD